MIWESVVSPSEHHVTGCVCSPVHTKLHWLQLEMWTLAWLTVIMGQHSNIKLVPANSILSNQTTTANILTAESDEKQQFLSKDHPYNILNHIHGLFAIKLSMIVLSCGWFGSFRGLGYDDWNGKMVSQARTSYCHHS